MLRWLVLGLAVLVVAGCSSVSSTGGGGGRYALKHDRYPSAPQDVSQVPDAVPRVEAKSRHGNASPYTVLGKTYYVRSSAAGYRERGYASWYGEKFQGHATSNGEIYDMYQMTAANKTLPLPSYAQVTNLNNGRKVIVRVNDRGPFHEGRIIDLSYAAAYKLDMLGHGTAPVEVVAIDPRTWNGAQSSTSSRGSVTIKGNPVGRYLQMGAFSQRANAGRVRDELSQSVSGIDVAVREAQRGTQTLYKVVVGPLKSRSQVSTLEDVAYKLGLSTPILVD